MYIKNENIENLIDINLIDINSNRINSNKLNSQSAGVCDIIDNINTAPQRINAKKL